MATSNFRTSVWLLFALVTFAQHASPQAAQPLIELRLASDRAGPGYVTVDGMVTGAVRYVERTPIVSDADFVEVRPHLTESGVVLSVVLSADGASRLERTTEESIGGTLVVLFDSRVASIATIRSAIGGGGHLTVPLELPRATAIQVADQVNARWANRGAAPRPH